MSQVKPLVVVPGGFKQVAATDQVAMDGGLVTVTETGAAAAKALPDALAGKFDKAGGAIGGPVSMASSLVVSGYMMAPLKGRQVGSLDLTVKQDGGFAFGTSVTAAKGWPVDAAYSQLIQVGDATDPNYFSFQICGGSIFDNDNFFVRKTQNNTNTPWRTLLHDGNVAKVANKAINFRQKKFNIVDYGAVDNGDPSAVTTAANSQALYGALYDIAQQPNAGTLVLPNGRFVLNNAVERYDLPHGIDVEGTGNSELFFNSVAQGGNGLGLGVTGGADGRIKVRGLRVLGRNFGSNQGGTLVALYGGGQDGGVSIDTLYINCDSTCLPVNHLLIKNPASSGNIRGINITGGGGAYGGTGGTTGISVYSDRLATDVSFHDVYMYAVGTGFSATMGQTQSQYTLEGVAFTACVLVGVQKGLVTNSGWYQAPGYSWKGGHINAQQYCFLLNRMAHFAIDGVNAQLDISNSPQAILFGQGCVGIHVTNNRFAMVDQLGSGKAFPDVSGVLADGNSTVWTVTGNHFANFTPGSNCVVGQSGASVIRAFANLKFASGSTGGGMLAGSVIDLGGNSIAS